MTESKHTSKWIYDVMVGSEGQQDHAWVYDDNDTMVGVFKIHHAMKVVRIANAHQDLITALEGAVEKLRDLWVIVDGEFGAGRSVDQAGSDLWHELVEAEVAIRKAKGE